ncbi:30S ribosome-binding factor RbfA [Eubacteriales bacterium mix99]|jgi:ribosome-binding factor A
MAQYRINRISEEITREVSEIVRTEVKDPRISKLFSIVKTEVSGDLHYARIHFSVMDTEEDRENTLKGLKKASGFIRSELARRLSIRFTPELQFIPDQSIEYSVEISKKIKEIHQNEGNGENKNDD